MRKPPEFAIKLKKDAEAELLALQKLSLNGSKGLGNLKNKRQAIYFINPYTIRLDYTYRDIDSESTKQHIDNLARSIRENGVINALTVYWGGGQPVCYIGYCRYLAAIRAIEVYGTQLRAIPVTLVKYAGNEIDRLIRLILSNYTKPLEQFELRNAYERLTGYGLGSEKIAAATGQSVAEIDSILAGEAENRDWSAGQSEDTRWKQKCDSLIMELDLALKEIAEIKIDPAYAQIAFRLKQKAEQKQLRELKERQAKRRADVAAQRQKDDDELDVLDRAEVEDLQHSSSSLGASHPNETVPISAADKQERPDTGRANSRHALTREIVWAAIQRYFGRPYFTLNQIRAELRDFVNGFADKRSFSKAIARILNDLADESKITKLEHPLRGKWSIS